MSKKLNKKIILKFKMISESGLHIGGSKSDFEIGGVDNVVIRNPIDKWPYVPGSSLKGKIRALLEICEGKKFNKNGIHQCNDESCKVCKYFGTSPSENSKNNNEKKDENSKDEVCMSRIIFRDAFITSEWKDKLKNMESELLYTECKTENSINRLNCIANPRTIERVVAGTEFDVEFVLTVFEGDNEEDMMNFLKKGIKLLELDYLGGSGTRGSGKVKFEFSESKVFGENGDWFNEKQFEKAKEIFGDMK